LNAAVVKLVNTLDLKSSGIAALPVQFRPAAFDIYCMQYKIILAKVLIIGIPTFATAYMTDSMVYTIPMLAITTIVATSITELKTIDKRVNVDISKDSKDNLDG
tara:strand:+ start:196 stop:507 length:312 start_codon:yes stop_codon:yes gene_type:complete